MVLDSNINNNNILHVKMGKVHMILRGTIAHYIVGGSYREEL